jgi:hypothetical protein
VWAASASTTPRRVPSAGPNCWCTEPITTSIGAFGFAAGSHRPGGGCGPWVEDDRSLVLTQRGRHRWSRGVKASRARRGRGASRPPARRPGSGARRARRGSTSGACPSGDRGASGAACTFIDGHRRVTTLFAQVSFAAGDAATRAAVPEGCSGDRRRGLDRREIDPSPAATRGRWRADLRCSTSSPDDGCRAVAAASRLTRFAGSSIGLGTGTVFAGRSADHHEACTRRRACRGTPGPADQRADRRRAQVDSPLPGVGTMCSTRRPALVR